MHPSAYAFAATALAEADVKGGRVVEAGGLNVNGSAREAIEKMGPASYLSTDMRDGAGVDQVCDAGCLAEELGRGAADVVISTEMLEHAGDWRAAVTGMTELLAPDGLLLLTARGPGFPLHGYPEDHWRFTVDTMTAILGACALEILRCEPDPDPASPGVLALARKPAGWRRPRDLDGLLLGIELAPAGS
jgi:SAM-dependent methyltransferase